ncbi:hypothetical protein [Rhizobium sp. Leaf386]|uniref:hypothetical protein n=1 Tax=Rhizobium sp. Leaf386 TaxID=1736359 RepID=UPI00071307C1|nr:hypothetical protein [Rhizobium sp. Leaf386]KQS90337.1 hypothetical protein ASG50_07735 [Rhizobium sp. Leaf386]
MSKAGAFTKTEMKHFADVAIAKNATVEVRRGETVFRVSPAQKAAQLDEDEESDIDREIAAFKVKHGIS